MRIYSYAFHFLLSLVMLGIAVVSLLSGQHNLSVAAVPWEGDVAAYILLGAGVAGFVVTWRAATGAGRVVFMVWSLVIFAAVARGYFFSSYHFTRPEQLSFALYFTGAVLLAAVGGWLQYRKPKEKRLDYGRYAATS